MTLPLPTLTPTLLVALLGLAATTPGLAQASVPDPASALMALHAAASPPLATSRAVAWSTYYGSYASSPCSSSFAFWECRGWLDLQDPFDERNRSVEESQTGAVVRADRRGPVWGPEVDQRYAVSWARARTQFGANSVEAHAWHGGTWTETRVIGASNGATSSRLGASSAGATAYSEWTDIFTTNISGMAVLEFSLRQHPGSTAPAASGFPLTPAPSGAWGVLQVQVRNLDAPWPGEFWPETIGRTDEDGAGASFMSLSLMLTAGHSYSLRSVLEATASNNASADFYGTARLDRFVVSPGQSLSFASGTAYTVAVVPEPGSWALMLGGLAVVGRLAAQRRVARRQG